MNELISHSLIYPQMEICDAVKLLYQQTFGGGHLIENPEENFQYLTKEYEKAEDSAPLIEPIGGGFSRLYLAAAKRAGISAKLIQQLFLLSAEKRSGETEDFRKKLQEFLSACQKGLLPFDAAEAEAYLTDYEAAGFPPVSHSETYRKAYQPAYRLILSDYAKLMPLFEKISNWDQKAPLIIAIDGKCGSGKTTLASLLSSLFPCSVIHMDDFFLPPALRTEERLGEAGGNIHYERFSQEVLPYLRKAEPFSYRKFDCSVGDYNGFCQVEKLLRIVEGSYSMHPKFSSQYDYTVFLNIPSALQEERIKQRNGTAVLKTFQNKWIPIENRYFEEMAVEDRCNLRINLWGEL